MKTIIALLLGVSLSVAAQAQTADEIIDKYFEQIGGKQKWAELKSLKSTGKLKMQGMDLPISMLQKAPNKQKMAATFQGMTFVQPCFDGAEGWNTNQMTMKPEKMAAEDSENMKDEAMMEDPFLNYAQKGYKVELQGKETIEGTECHKMKLTRKPVMVDGKPEENVSYYFFSVADNVPIMSRSVVKKGQAKGATVETFLSDYQDAGGYIMPHSMTIKYNGKPGQSITMEKFEPNVAIDDSEFGFPKQ
jgi:outer membrane lipoprotein-sorting protein